MDGTSFVNGNLDGGGEINVLDYSDFTTPVTIDLSAFDATGMKAVVGIRDIIGGQNNDTLTGDTGDNRLTGGPGDDQLVGLGGNDTYIFSGNNWGVDTLTEASGPGTGQDTLDFSGATDDLIFSFGTLQVTGGGNSANMLSNNFERLLGGTGADQFVFSDGFTLAGGGSGTFIDGGAGVNTLDYAAYTTSVNVNLTTGAATGVNGGLAGGIANLQNATGGSAGDVLVGDSQANILIGNNGPDQITGNAGADTLNGGPGDDTYYFSGGDWGSDTLTNSGDSDTLNFTAATDNLTFNIKFIQPISFGWSKQPERLGQ